jgi:hypothetical protein
MGEGTSRQWVFNAGRLKSIYLIDKIYTAGRCNEKVLPFPGELSAVA